MARQEQGCLSEEALELYALGRLPEEEVAPLEEHLLVCAACQDRLAETDAYVRAMRQAARKFMMLPPSRWQLLWARFTRWFENPAVAWTAAAACVVVIALLGPRLLFGPARGGTAPITVLLEASRGAEKAGISTAPAGKPLQLALDARGLPTQSCCRVEVVDSEGQRVTGAVVREEKQQVGLRLQPLAKGRYWVRLYAAPPEDALLREFGLEVR